MTDALTILPPQRPLRGSVAPPGSKSITNRALLMAALAKGTSHIEGALKSDDTRHMAVALRAMSVIVDEPDDTTFIITGTGQLQVPKEPLFLGNAGTATRFLTAAAALVEGAVTVTGDFVESFSGASIRTYSDHRIAMSLALAGLRVSGVTILDPGCVGKTYPDYWKDMAALGVSMKHVSA